jgi:hypothetical protein
MTDGGLNLSYKDVTDGRTVGSVQGCHNGRFWMKMSVRTSFSSGRPLASAFTRGRGSAFARDGSRYVHEFEISLFIYTIKGYSRVFL